MDQYGSGICGNAFDASPIKVFEPEWNMQKFFSESVLLRRLNIDGVIYGFGGFPLVIREKMVYNFEHITMEEYSFEEEVISGIFENFSIYSAQNLKPGPTFLRHGHAYFS